MAHQANDGYLDWEVEQAQWDWDTAHIPTGSSSEESSTMDESLMEQYHVNDDSLLIVKFFYLEKNIPIGNDGEIDGTKWIRDS